MILRREGRRVLALGQTSHAWVSGQLARSWGNQQFPRPQPAEAIALGAEQHDIGWARFDLKPEFDPETSLPRSFLKTSVQRHLAIWADAPETLLAASSYAALVASMHGRALSELRRRNADCTEARLLDLHITAERERQSLLSGRLDLSEAQTRVIQEQMWAWDGISLALCHGWADFETSAPAAAKSVPLRMRSEEGNAFIVDPWPFTIATVEVHCEARPLAPSYRDEQELQDAFQAAIPERLTFTLRRAATALGGDVIDGDPRS